jgi:hypothetical protein
VEKRGVGAVEADERPGERMGERLSAAGRVDPRPGGDDACLSYVDEAFDRLARLGIVFGRRAEDPARARARALDPTLAQAAKKRPITGPTLRR